MKDFEALKDIWHGQTEQSTLSYEDIIKNIHKSRGRFANKLLFQVATLAFSVLALFFILSNNDFTFGTSTLGVVIFIFCLLYYLFVQVRDYRKISKSDHLLGSPDEYIAWLKSYKHHRYVLNTSVYRIYMVFVAAGLGLLLIEVFFKMALWQTLLAVGFIIVWFFVCYYVFMRLYIRKEETRLNEMISNLERLERQFEEAEA